MEHYFSEKQSSKFVKRKIEVHLFNKTFYFYTAPGVFSKTRFDIGSEFLVQTAIIKNGWKVLDLGCGYGAVGVIIKAMHPNVEVWAADINERAVHLAKMNAELNKVKISVIKSDSFSNLSMFFDTILFNPPQAAGLKLCYKMIEDSFNHLRENGVLQLVARHNKGGSRFEKLMLELFGNVEIVRGHKKYSKYTVYKSEKKSGRIESILNKGFLK